MDKHARPRLSLDMLKGFEAAARRLSFTLAAEEMFVTQSAISRQVKTLEDQLGLPLFRRVNRGLELTAAGHTLYGAVSAASALIDDATDKLLGAKGRTSVTVTTAVPFASFWLAPRLHRFAAAHSSCDVRVVATNHPGEFERDGVDVAILHYRAGSAPASARRLAPDEVSPVCAPALLKNPAKPLRHPQDLAHHVLLRLETLIAGRRRVDWVRWLQATGLSKLRPAGSMNFSHYDQLIQSALDGSGVALGRFSLIAPLLREGRLVVPFPEHRVAAGGWHVVTAVSSNEQKAVRAFVDWLHQEALDAHRDITN